MSSGVGSRTRHGSAVAVAVAVAVTVAVAQASVYCSSNVIPGQGTSICCQYRAKPKGNKQTNKQNKTDQRALPWVPGPNPSAFFSFLLMVLCLFSIQHPGVLLALPGRSRAMCIFSIFLELKIQPLFSALR